jgi:hypothetical protein
MRRYSLLVCLVLVSVITGALALPASSDPPAKTIRPSTAIYPAPEKKAAIASDFGRLPLSFERNQGQTDSRVRFLTHSADSTLFLTPSEAVFSMAAPSQRNEKPARLKGRKARNGPRKIAHVALRMQMVGAAPNAMPLTQQPLPGRVNYFLGKDPNKWHAGVPTFRRVGFHAVYPGIDLVYYGNQRRLEYDFVVAPHADPKQIQLRFAGAQGVHVSAMGDLIVRTQGRELRWQKPTVYQQDAAGKRSVTARFRLKRLPSGQAGVSFALGHYDMTRPLTIDPVLLYSTFLGGSYGDYATGIAIDSSGNSYIAGSASSLDFPTTAGDFQRAKQSGTDVYTAFVTKLNPTGTALVYSTFLGGTVGSFAGNIAIDSSGNAYVTGYTDSTNFPVTPGAFQRVNLGGRTVFITKLDPNGAALLYSTYLGGRGGAGGGDSAGCIAVDNSGSAYVAGQAYSTDFPVTPGSLQGVNKAQGLRPRTAFVTRLNSAGTGLLYSTYLGGSGSNGDGVSGIAIDGAGNAYVAGTTSSFDFPVTPGAFQRANNALSGMFLNAFVSKINPTGTALVYSTYLGGSRGDNAGGIAIDSSGNAYIVGSTDSADFPVTAGAFQRVKNGSLNNAFVTKLNSMGTALLYSTYLGGSGRTGVNGSFGDSASAVAIDSSGNAYVIGAARSFDFPVTQDALQRVNNAPASYGSNAFLTKFNSTGSALLYSTYLGGSNTDSVSSIAVTESGAVYLAGGAGSTDFPVTAGAFQRVNRSLSGLHTAFITKLSLRPAFPDFNNDGSTDLLLQNPTTGAIASWFMQGSSRSGGADFSLIPPAEYALVGAGDFRGDGATTLVLQSRITNQVAFWYTSGVNSATIPGGHFVNVTPDAGWKVVGVGDFNGDGKSDLVFQNQTTHQIAIWFMNGYTDTGGVLLPYSPVTGWNVVGTGDVNADGFPDLIFQNQSTGQIAVWFMDGTTYVGGTVLTGVPAPGWNVVGVGDYNGDGSADLLFQNQTSNQAAVWYLKNGAFVGGDTLSVAPPFGWKIVGPR